MSVDNLYVHHEMGGVNKNPFSVSQTIDSQRYFVV